MVKGKSVYAHVQCPWPMLVLVLVFVSDCVMRAILVVAFSVPLRPSKWNPSRSSICALPCGNPTNIGCQCQVF